MIYKVHYPDGAIRKHQTAPIGDYWYKCSPGLDKVFYYQTRKISLFLRIVEMSEEEIWTEKCPEFEYHAHVMAPNHGKFVYFQMNSFLELLEF